MEHAVLDININSNDSSTSSSQQNSNRNARLEKNENAPARIFKRPRTRSQSNGMDILARIKQKVGDMAYSNRYEAAVKKLKGAEGATDNASKAASRAKFGAAAGIAAIAASAKMVVSTTMDLASINTSNQAYKNQIDNMRTGLKQGIGAAAGIAAAGIAGGLIGILAALAVLAVKLSTDAIKLNAETNRKNQIDIYETERKKNRLGYIETGYSR